MSTLFSVSKFPQLQPNPHLISVSNASIKSCSVCILAMIITTLFHCWVHNQLKVDRVVQNNNFITSESESYTTV